MANKKKSFTWKGILIGLTCLAVGVGGTIGVIKLVEHVKKTPPAEQGQTEQQPEQPATGTSLEFEIANQAITNFV